MLEFDYRLTGAGWSESRIADEHAHAELTASYLSDALRDLIEAVTEIVKGREEARCSWAEEPGEYRWIMRRYKSAVELTILWFEDDDEPFPDADGSVVFATWQPADAVGRAILEGVEHLRERVSDAQYKHEWIEAPFPTSALEALRESLDASA